MDLVSRFYDPAEGEILIEEINVNKMSLQFLRRNIGIVLQDTILFSGTVFENVRVGRPDASENEVVEALKNACA